MILFRNSDSHPLWLCGILVAWQPASIYDRLQVSCDHTTTIYDVFGEKPGFLAKFILSKRRVHFKDYLKKSGKS